MVLGAARFSPIVPSPEPVAAVTVQVVLEPVTPVSDEPVSPLGSRTKSPASTPPTFSVKVTVQETDAPLVDGAPVRLIEETVGAVLSTVNVLLAALAAVASVVSPVHAPELL